jgi:transcriptional regulator with XRE-family HTH domain
MKLRVIEICKKAGITQKELAERIAMSPVGLSKAINGNPTKDTLEKIANALNVPVTELFEQPQSDVVNCPACGARLELKRKG